MTMIEARYKTKRIQTGWDSQRTAEVIRLWDDGHSAAAIAEAIGGCTRNAVIGKVNRLGLKPRRTVSFVNTSTGLARSSTPKTSRITIVSPSMFARKARGFKKAPIPPPKAPTLEFKVGFFQLDAQHCRFPLWTGDEPLAERFYCGSPKALVPENGPYCRWHHNHTHDGLPERKISTWRA